VKIKSGSFLGTGGNTTINGVGFQGIAMFTKNRTTTGQAARGKFATMGAFGFSVVTGDYWNSTITAFTADGFSITSDFISGDTYDYICFGLGGEEDIVQSSYVGDDSDNHDIVIDPAFESDLVIVIREENGQAFTRFRTRDSVGDSTRRFSPNGTGPSTNLIQAINADGFEVGTGLNANGETYHYLCLKSCDIFEVFDYVGNGASDRQITGILPFTPENVFITGDLSTHEGLCKWKGQASNVTNGWQNGTRTDWIEAFLSDGIEIGNHASVNQNGNSYLGMAFKDGTSTPPTVIPVIDDIQPRTFNNGDLVEITGSNFKASQGTGKTELGDNREYAFANKREQTIDHWEDIAIRFIVDRGTLPNGAVFVFVTNDDGETSPDPPEPGTDPTYPDTELEPEVTVAGIGSNTSIELRLEHIYAGISGHTAPSIGRDRHFLMTRIGIERGINLTSGYKSFEGHLAALYKDLTGNTWQGGRSAEKILRGIESAL